MRIIILVAAIGLMPNISNAAWFCGQEPTEFAAERAFHSLAPVKVREYEIISGYYPSGTTRTICSGSTCITVPNDNSGVSQPDWKRVVDKYEAKVNALDDWAETLEDGCLRDAYHDVVVGERKQISKDRRAIEFMKTPEPLEPGS